MVKKSEIEPSKEAVDKDNVAKAEDSQATKTKKQRKTSTKNKAKNTKEVKRIMGKAIGFIETRGLTAAIEAADNMLKSAEVSLVGMEKIGSGLITITIQGDVGAVKAATEAGSEAASRIGELIAVHVIPRPHNSMDLILPKAK